MNTIVLDSYDKAAFNDIKDQTPALQNLEEEGVSVNLGFPELMEDVYGSLYKYNPEVKDPIDQGSMANKTIMEQLMQSREYNELREFTRLQEFESAVGVRSFSEHIISEIPEEMNKMANEMSVTQSMLDRLLEEYDPNAQDNPNPGLIKQAKEKLDNLQGQMKQYTQKHEDEIRQMVRTAIQKGADDAKQVQGFMNTFGSEPGQVCQLPMKEKISMAEKVLKNKSLHKLAEMAGRFQRLALHYQSSKVKHGADEIVDTELGNNLNRIVPSELIYLDDPDLESLFYLKYSQRNLLQFKMEGKDKKAKGPIIICIDNSGSMQGSREQWSKAFALGLLTIARKQKRPFAIIHFGSRNELKYFTFEKNIDSNYLLEALSWFFGGGTDFEAPMLTAMNLIGERKELKEADIVFVTDGECSVGSKFLDIYKKMKEEMQFRVLGVLIETIAEELPFPTDGIFKLAGGIQNDEVLLQEIYSKL